MEPFIPFEVIEERRRLSRNEGKCSNIAIPELFQRNLLRIIGGIDGKPREIEEALSGNCRAAVA